MFLTNLIKSLKGGRGMGRLAFDERMNRGIDALANNETKEACRWFAVAQRQKGLTRLERGLASVYYSAALMYRWEKTKEKFGNANERTPGKPFNWGQGWSDVEIAAVLYSKDYPVVKEILAWFLGRTYDAVGFIYDYAFRPRPIHTWTNESGRHYTRYTQTKAVQRKLGL